MMSIKGTRITNGYGDVACGDENDTDVEDGDTDDDNDMMMDCGTDGDGSPRCGSW